MCPLRGHDVTCDFTKSLSKYMTRFLLSSYFFCEYMMHSSGYVIPNEFAINKLSLDVPVILVVTSLVT